MKISKDEMVLGEMNVPKSLGNPTHDRLGEGELEASAISNVGKFSALDQRLYPDLHQGMHFSKGTIKQIVKEINMKPKSKTTNDAVPKMGTEQDHVHNEDHQEDSHADLWQVGQWVIEISKSNPALPCRLRAWTGSGMEEWEAVRADVDPDSGRVLFPGFHYHIMFVDRVPYYFRKLKAQRTGGSDEPNKALPN